MNTKIDKIFTEVSAGELVDKITILEIKKVKISKKEKLDEINKELDSLISTFKKHIPSDVSIKNQIIKLKDINLKLWEIVSMVSIWRRMQVCTYAHTYMHTYAHT